jgi:hypothetical protein
MTIINGRITDCQTNKAVPYATILNPASKTEGTTSSTDGNFSFEISASSFPLKINISSIGYKDTIVNLSSHEESVFLDIKLDPKVYKIDEVAVKSLYNNKESIGSKNYPVHITNGKSRGFSYESPGLGNGVYIKPTKNQANGLISSIDIYIADEGPLNCSFIIRMVVPKQRMETGKLVNLSNFKDILKAPIIYQPTTRGWNKIKTYEDKIQIPNQPFVILFIPVDEGPQYAWQHENGQEKYGSVIASTLNSNLPQMKWVTCFGNKIAVQSNKPISHTPLVVVNCLIQ